MSEPILTLNYFFFVFYVMKSWENQFLNLHTFDPGGGGGGPLSFTRKIPNNKNVIIFIYYIGIALPWLITG